MTLLFLQSQKTIDDLNSNLDKLRNLHPFKVQEEYKQVLRTIISECNDRLRDPFDILASQVPNIGDKL